MAKVSFIAVTSALALLHVNGLSTFERKAMALLAKKNDKAGTTRNRMLCFIAVPCQQQLHTTQTPKRQQQT